MISIIIPAHNAEKTIERAIYSIRELNVDTEIIVVENASNDLTVEIIKKLQNKLDNIVFAQSEKGVSKARNEGLKLARGEWIAFLDADDYYEKEIGDLIQKAVEDIACDLWLFGHVAGSECRPVSTQTQLYESECINSIRVEMINNPTKYMQVWAKLFRNRIIKENGLYFKEELTVSEDSDFTLRYTKHCRKIGISDRLIYHYTIDNLSTMRSTGDKKIEKYADALRITSQEVENENILIKHAFTKYILMHMNIGFVRTYFQDNNIKFQEKLRMIKKDIKMEPYYKAIQDVSVKECLSLRMLPTLFFKVHLPIFASLIFAVRGHQNKGKERNRCKNE